MNYKERLERVIPGGAHTYSRGSDQFPANAPQILDRGLGAYVFDPDGRKFLDYGMALRAVTLGYADPRVNAAAVREIEKGNNLTRASLTELAAAELLVDLIPSVEMVKFAKNGSNATTAAIKIARSYTGRRYVCIPRQHPFFSFDDWFIGTTQLQKGIPPEHAASTLVFDFNDLSSLKTLFDQHPGDIAAVMLEPATTVVPCLDQCASRLTADPGCLAGTSSANNFLHQVQRLCNDQGALFILDEMITGFRWHLGGAQAYFGVDPDLSTFGKGMANGFSVAAVAGKRKYMEVGSISQSGAERTFLLSTTHGGEMSGLGAFMETVRIYQEENVCRHLWDYGARLRDGMNRIAGACGMEKYFSMDGPAISLNYLTRDASGAVSTKFRTLFSQEMVRNGVLMPWIAISQSHGDDELAMTFTAVEKALRVYASALEDGVDKFLEGPEIKPVFRKYN
jgi:glutamate-1-semialdehyde 2,1-aminomutase